MKRAIRRQHKRRMKERAAEAFRTSESFILGDHMAYDSRHCGSPRTGKSHWASGACYLTKQEQVAMAELCEIYGLHHTHCWRYHNERKRKLV